MKRERRKNCEAIFGAFIPYAAISGRHATSALKHETPLGADCTALCWTRGRELQAERAVHGLCCGVQ
jgi:hypothetical protein